MAEQEDPKVALERLIGESERKSQEQKAISDELSRTHQNVIDLAQASRELLKYRPTGLIDYEREIPAWQRLNGQQDAMATGMQQLPYFELRAASTSSASGTISIYEVDNFIEWVPPAQHDNAYRAVQQLDYVLNDVADKTEVLNLLREFGLDKAVAGKKSPLELFQTAWQAYENPATDTSPLITWLIPMRESVEATIDALIQRRPNQEPAKGWRRKILSIGSQAGRPATGEVDFQDLADQWQVGGSVRPALEDELSDAKRASHDRAVSLTVLRRATLFLKQLLLSIDPARLRPVLQ